MALFLPGHVALARARNGDAGVGHGGWSSPSSTGAPRSGRGVSRPANRVSRLSIVLSMRRGAVVLGRSVPQGQPCGKAGERQNPDRP